MEIAWRDFIVFAWDSKDPNFRDAFERQTRTSPLPPDPSDENLSRYTEAFVIWVTKTQWGLEFAPKSFQEKFADRS